jgi:hypothetical protein
MMECFPSMLGMNTAAGSSRCQDGSWAFFRHFDDVLVESIPRQLY